MNNQEKSTKISYKPKAYRISENAVRGLSSLKTQTNKSYNLLFLDLIQTYKNAINLRRQKNKSDKPQRVTNPTNPTSLAVDRTDKKENPPR